MTVHRIRLDLVADLSRPHPDDTKRAILQAVTDVLPHHTRTSWYTIEITAEPVNINQQQKEALP